MKIKNLIRFRPKLECNHKLVHVINFIIDIIGESDGVASTATMYLDGLKLNSKNRYYDLKGLSENYYSLNKVSINSFVNLVLNKQARTMGF